MNSSSDCLLVKETGSFCVTVMLTSVGFGSSGMVLVTVVLEHTFDIT